MSNLTEFQKLSKLIRHLIFPRSDGDPGKHIENEIVARDRKYTELLDSYTTITKVRFWSKEIHKWLFFWFIIVACIFCIIAAYRVIHKIISVDNIQHIIDAIPALLAAITAFASTVIVVPLTITKFLFNTNEDDNITTLIQHTQQHDSAGITLLKDRFLKDVTRDQSNQKNISITDVTHD